MKKRTELEGILSSNEVKRYLDSRSEYDDVCLSLVDIDGFRKINEVAGLKVGDEVIGMLREAISSQTKVFYNLYAEKFIFFTNNISEAKIISRKILDTFAVPQELKGLSVMVDISIGGSESHKFGGISLPTMIAEAEKAHAVSKAGLGEKYNFYDHLPRNSVFNDLEIGYEINKALGEGDFCIYLQPKFTTSGVLVSAEALIRWDHPEHGILPPHEFIERAEKTWAIREITQESIRLSCEAISKLSDNGIDIKVAFNMSTKVLGYESQMVDWISTNPEVIPYHNRLEMEILEEGENAHNLNTIQNIQAISELGIDVALDDFGTGMSSLTYLLSFNAKILKIDKSIIDKIKTPRGSKIVSSVIKLTKELRITSVAEGVEEEAQLNLLKDMDVDLIQGYYFSKPLSINEFIEKYKK